MILNTLEFGLSPIIWVMQQVLQILWLMTGSAGTAIVMLSCLVATISYPLRGWAGNVETRIRDKKQSIDEKITLRAAGLKGEDRFRTIESVYKEYQYHPIQSIALGLSFLVMLPFLLSALFLLTSHPNMLGVQYLFIHDLSQPDGLLGRFNILPAIMSVVTLVDAKIRFSNDRKMFFRFCVIASVLFILVYNLSSALVLYWTVSNLISMVTYKLLNGRRKGLSISYSTRNQNN